MAQNVRIRDHIKKLNEFLNEFNTNDKFKISRAFNKAQKYMKNLSIESSTLKKMGTTIAYFDIKFIAL